MFSVFKGNFVILLLLLKLLPLIKIQRQDPWWYILCLRQRATIWIPFKYICILPSASALSCIICRISEIDTFSPHMYHSPVGFITDNHIIEDVQNCHDVLISSWYSIQIVLLLKWPFFFFYLPQHFCCLFRILLKFQW